MEKLILIYLKRNRIIQVNELQKRRRKKNIFKVTFCMDNERCRWWGNFSIGTKANWNTKKKSIEFIGFDLLFLPYASKTSKMCRIYWIQCFGGHVWEQLLWFTPFTTVWELKIRFACVDNKIRIFSATKFQKSIKYAFTWCDGVSLLLPSVTKIFVFFFLCKNTV